MADIYGNGFILTVQEDYAVGSMPPVGYLAEQEWAEVQLKAGLRTKCCSNCGIGCFPQQIGKTFQYSAKTSRGKEITLDGVLCLNCAKLEQHQKNEVKNDN